MITQRYRNLLAKMTHPSFESLVLYLDNEMAGREAESIRKHLGVCWRCRALRNRIEHSTAEFVSTLDALLGDTAAFPPRAEAQFEGKLRGLVAEIGSPSSLLSQLFKARSVVWLRSRSFNLTLGLIFLSALLFLSPHFRFVPSVSADEILRRVESAETRRTLKVPQAVVYQKLRVARRSANLPIEQSVTWEIWNEAGGSRFRQRVRDGTGTRFIPSEAEQGKDPWLNSPLVPRVLLELHQILQANRIDVRRPLSASAYETWKHSAQPTKEHVLEQQLPDGNKVFTLRASVSGSVEPNRIVEAELVVGAEDWHPVSERLLVQEERGISNYELAETGYGVYAFNTLPPSIFSDIFPAVINSPLPKPATNILSPVPAPPDWMEIEIQAHYALHRLHACVGEPVEVKSNVAGAVEVEGLAESAKRKEELVSALQGIPHLVVKIQTTEALSNQTPDAPISSESTSWEASSPFGPLTSVKVQNRKLPFQDQLHEFLETSLHDQGSRDRTINQRIAEFSAAAVALSKATSAEAWALRRLAERYPPEKVKELQGPNRWLLQVMVRDHLTALRSHAAESRSLLMPFLSFLKDKKAEAVSYESEAQSPDQRSAVGSNWWLESVELFALVDRTDQFVAYLFAGDSLGDNQAEFPHDLLVTLDQLQMQVKSAEVAVLENFSVGFESLTSQNRPSVVRAKAK